MSLGERRRGKLRAIARAFLVVVTCSVLMTVTSKGVKPQRGCNCGHLWSAGASCFTEVSHTVSSAQPSNPRRP